MFADERRNAIVELVNKNGSITVSQLMDTYGVSIETVRRDLEYLEKKLLLKRVHGGAISGKGMQKISQLRERLSENIEKKQKLCRTAMQFVSENDVIFLDSGSTPIELAKLIRDNIKHAVIITNSPELLEILSANSGLELILTGGKYYVQEHALYGTLAVDSIKALHAHKAFVFPTSVNLSGIGADHYEFVDIQRAYIQSADKVFILADSTKVNKSALHMVSALQESFTVITDDELAETIYSTYKKNGIKIIK